MLEELATLDELHDEVDAVGFLEHVVHSDDERMINLMQNQFFNLKRLYGLVLDYNIFPDAFHGIVCA